MAKKKELITGAAAEQVLPQKVSSEAPIDQMSNKKIFTLAEAAALGLEGMLAQRQQEFMHRVAPSHSTGISLLERVNRDYTLYSLDGNSASCYYGVELLDYDDVGVNPFKVRKYFVCTDFEKRAAELQPGHQHWKLFRDMDEYLVYMKQHNMLLDIDNVPYHEEIWYQYKGIWYRRVPVTAANITKTFDGKYRCNLIDINLSETVLKRIYEEGYSESIEQQILGQVNEDVLDYKIDWANWNK